MPSNRSNFAVRQVANHPSAILLAVQLVGVLIYPFMEDAAAGRSLFETFGIIVLGLAIWSVRDSAGSIWISLALGAAAATLSIINAVSASSTLVAPSAITHALFYFWAAGNLLVYMLRDRRVTTDELFAVGATFTLVAWGFAYIFMAVQQLQPGAFIAAVDPQAQRTWMELLFMSFTTLSSTGLSDVVPITAHSRAFVMIEQLVGLGYVALVVSRLVGLTISRQATKEAIKEARELS